MSSNSEAVTRVTTNGPAIWGGCVTRRSTGQGPVTLATILSRCKARVWRTFCLPIAIGTGTNFSEHYACRGTRFIGATNLSPVTKLVTGTGAVSRYKLSRSQKFVKVQDLNCVQMRVSGCNGYYEFVLGAGAKAKSVTTCPAFSIKKRETTYPYCPCYSYLLFNCPGMSILFFTSR